MSNTTLTNIPSNLDIKIKEPSDGAHLLQVLVAHPMIVSH